MSNYTTRGRTVAGALTAALTLAAATPVMAQGGAGMFQQADVNGDGQITRDEIVSFSKGRVDMLDGNDDGAFTENDLRGWIDQQIATATQRQFQQRDVDGDGRISQSEFTKGAQKPEAAAQMFQSYDRNGDGALTQGEMTAITKKMVNQRRDQQRAQSQNGQDAIANSFATLDENGDGQVTRKEAVARANRMFDARDKNGDGTITLDEIRQRRGQGQGSGKSPQ